jgi:hypothetical protein
MKGAVWCSAAGGGYICPDLQRYVQLRTMQIEAQLWLRRTPRMNFAADR